MVRLAKTKKKRSALPLFLCFFLLLAGGGAYLFIKYFEGIKPVIEVDELKNTVGKNSPLSVTFSDNKSGLRSIRIALRQGQTEKEVISKTFPKQTTTSQRENNTEEVNVELNIKELGLKDGEATLVIEATDHSMRRLMKGNIHQISHPVRIDTKAPKITILHSERYIRSGGSGIVIYKIDDAVKKGVRINGVFTPGFPLIDESDDRYITYFAMPYDAEKLDETLIVAEDEAGNVTEKGFAPIVKKSKAKHDKINIGDNFLSRKIPEFEANYAEMNGSHLEKFLYANTQVRIMNNKKIHDLCMNPDTKRHWSGRFLRMAGSGKAGFAERRTYYSKGKPIDKQVHLGVDIASTRRAGVKAANAGKVIFSDYLGIYGHMIMIDHGQGVVSLYSHLSQINVSSDDMVKKGDIIGNTGTSGMAGGDHLHFSMLVNGIFVTPKEWWDPNWIEVTIDGPIMDSKF